MTVMNSRPGRISSLASTTLYLVIFLAGSFFFLLPTADPAVTGLSRDTAWRGYFTLLVGDDVSSALVTEALGRAGIRGVVSQTSASVSFNDIAGIATVAVADLSKRLDPRDPRLDPYMKGLPSYFHTRVNGRGMQILYLPAHASSILRINQLVHRSLDRYHIDWFLLEWSGLRRLLFAATFAIFVALLLYRTRRHRLLVALGALPWAAGVIAGGYGGFAASCVLAFAWAYVAEEGIPLFERFFEDRARKGADDTGGAGGAAVGPSIREFRARSAFYLLALAVAAVLRYDAAAGPISLLGLLPGLLATAALAALAAAKMRRQADNREHRLFLPNRILRRNAARALRGVYLSAVPILLILVMLPPVILLAIPSGTPVNVPRPVGASAGGGLSWSSLQRLWDRSRTGTLPDLADYITHRAYQDTFLYQSADASGGGIVYRFPRPDEQISIPGYAFDGMRVTEHPQVMFTFSEAWFQRQVAGAQGVAAMLRAQGRPTQVMVEPAGRVYGDGGMLLRHAGIVLLLFLPFLISLVRLTVRIRFGLRDTLVRRKKIEA